MADPYLTALQKRYADALTVYQLFPTNQRYTRCTILRFCARHYCREHGLSFPEDNFTDPGMEELRQAMIGAWRAYKRNGVFYGQ